MAVAVAKNFLSLYFVLLTLYRNRYRREAALEEGVVVYFGLADRG